MDFDYLVGLLLFRRLCRGALGWRLWRERGGFAGAFLDFALLGFAPLVLVLRGLFFYPQNRERGIVRPLPCARRKARPPRVKKRKENRLGSSVVSGFGFRWEAAR